MPYFNTFRPRGGDSRVVQPNTPVTVTIPAYANQILANCSLNGGGAVISDSATPPPHLTGNYGWWAAGAPLLMKVSQGRDKYLHLTNFNAVANTIDLTFGN